MVAEGLAVDVATRRHPGWRALTTAVTTWAVVGAQSLSHEGRVMADVLASGDAAVLLLSADEVGASPLLSADDEQADKRTATRTTVKERMAAA